MYLLLTSQIPANQLYHFVKIPPVLTRGFRLFTFIGCPTEINHFGNRNLTANIILQSGPPSGFSTLLNA